MERLREDRVLGIKRIIMLAILTLVSTIGRIKRRKNSTKEK